MPDVKQEVNSPIRLDLSKPFMIEFPELGDTRGHLVIAEGMKNIPFNIKRIFYIYGSDKNVIRGQHANKVSQFMLINVAGTSKVKVDYGNGRTEIFSLNKPHVGLFIPRMVWKDMYDFSKDSVLLCLADTTYDADEYVRDKQEYYFLKNRF